MKFKQIWWISGPLLLVLAGVVMAFAQTMTSEFWGTGIMMYAVYCVLLPGLMLTCYAVLYGIYKLVQFLVKGRKQKVKRNR